VIDTLNHYLSEMSDAILNHGGTSWPTWATGSWPVRGAARPGQPRRPRLAARPRRVAALDQSVACTRDVRLPRFDAWIREQGLGEGLRTGIGLNSGA